MGFSFSEYLDEEARKVAAVAPAKVDSKTKGIEKKRKGAKISLMVILKMLEKILFNIENPVTTSLRAGNMLTKRFTGRRFWLWPIRIEEAVKGSSIPVRGDSRSSSTLE